MDEASASRSDPGAQEQAWPSPFRRWYAVAVLTLGYILSFADRQILALLIGPIQEDLNITDTEISLLIGLSFALCYTLAGFPLGWLVDRTNRRNIVAIGVGVWSLMTAACGFASTYAQLFVARMGVGLGEAALSPAAYSILSDSFPPERRARAISVYTGGAIMGLGLAFIAGGAVITAVSNAPPVTLPLIGELRAWQVPLVLLGVLGLVFVLAVMGIAEPARREVSAAQASDGAAERGGLLAFTLTRWRIVLGICFGMAAQSVVAYGLMSWMPTVFIRRFDFEAGEAGVLFGIVVAVFGLAGNYGGAALSERWTAKGRPGALIMVCVLAAAGLLPFVAFAPTLNASWAVLALTAPTIFFLTLPTAVAPTALQTIAPNAVRGRVAALFIFVTSMAGLTLGPLTVALFTDFVFRDPDAVGASVAMTGLLLGAISLLMFWQALGPFARLTKARLEAG
ncbi:MAG: MFS transporter [Oceanicaulis sp.]